MKGKAALIVGLAAGYVLGARDGRERFEQIKSQATQLANDPRVQEKATQATDLAKEKAPLVKDKVSSSTGKVTSKLPGGSRKKVDDAPSDLDAVDAVDAVDALDDEVVVVTTTPTPADTFGGPRV